MAPIRKGDGTALEIPGVSEVRSGDGRVFFEDAIPDSVEYNWLPSDYNEGNWIDQISGIDLPDDEGSPTKKTDGINDKAYIEYDGDDLSSTADNALDEEPPLVVFLVSDFPTNKTNDRIWSDTIDQTFYQDNDDDEHFLIVEGDSLRAGDAPITGLAIREIELGGAGDEVIRQNGEEIGAENLADAGLNGFVLSGEPSSPQKEQDVYEISIAVDPSDEEIDQERERLADEHNISLS